MRAITLWNPYCTLAAIGQKRWETRSYRMPPGTVLALHSSKTMPKQAKEYAETRDFRKALGKEPMVNGCILAVATVGKCYSTRQWIHDHCQRGKIRRAHELEYLFGDYDPGRFAWELTNLRRLATPIPCKGAQGPWRVPADIEAMIQEQLNAELRGAGEAPSRNQP